MLGIYFICSLDEFRAFEGFTKSLRVKYEVLGAVGEYSRVCIKPEFRSWRKIHGRFFASFCVRVAVCGGNFGEVEVP
jgi:hypothetical protein